MTTPTQRPSRQRARPAAEERVPVVDEVDAETRGEGRNSEVVDEGVEEGLGPGDVDAVSRQEDGPLGPREKPVDISDGGR